MTYAWTELAAVDANGASSSDALARHRTQVLAQLAMVQHETLNCQIYFNF